MGKDLSQAELATCVADKGLLNKGEIGCALSHLAVLQKLLDSDKKHLFVFEDDAEITGEFIANLQDIEKFIDEQPGPALLLLFRTHAKYKAVRTIKSAKIWIIDRGIYSPAYVVNRAAAANIIKAETPLKFEIDAWHIFVKLNLLKLYCLDKDLIRYQDPHFCTDSLVGHGKGDNPLTTIEQEALKYQHLHDIYKQFTLQQRIGVQLNRLAQHVRNIYWEEF